MWRRGARSILSSRWTPLSLSVRHDSKKPTAPIAPIAPAAPPSPTQKQPTQSTRTKLQGNLSSQAQVEVLKQEILLLRLQLAKATNTHTALYQEILGRLEKTDIQAQENAMQLRHTALSLSCSTDRIEKELRALLEVGCTDEEIDVAALESGARRFVRQNVGYRPVTGV
ncbi:hypothetical protein AGDE_14207 [Angomonas deanei]|uniref:Uncharacterized protein n=1 Tax=Angomonas deanei TaxID=59799 RepID=A0A7G2CNV3_9TRYP|nr:hypothetical protein AGDE_14207 [Angomonas deanei]CAD2221039.1 hypothetical protein, conserved [Angomonas deanei]|eukprot:EPY21219.1 hypothetical protein AGDE_14207 [Angomonas deanei]